MLTDQLYSEVADSNSFNVCFQGPMTPKMPQLDLIAELKKRQVQPQVREGKDGALEDIITGTVTLPCRSPVYSCVSDALEHLCFLCLRSEEHAVQADGRPAAAGHLEPLPVRDFLHVRLLSVQEVKRNEYLDTLLVLSVFSF